MQKGLLLIYDEHQKKICFSAFGNVVEVPEPLQTGSSSCDSLGINPGVEYDLLPFQDLRLLLDLKQSHLQIPFIYSGRKTDDENSEPRNPLGNSKPAGFRFRIKTETLLSQNAIPPALIHEDQRKISVTTNRFEYIPERLLRAIRFIETNLSRRISLDEIAQEACLSRFHFSRLFKKHFAVSPMQFILNLRIYIATILLQNSDASIFQVSVRAGFNNLSEFYRQFKKSHKMTPSEFRSSLPNP